MPIRRFNRVLPIVIVDRATVLNSHLSPTARLLYVLLLATTDDKGIVERAAQLAGVGSIDELRPFIAELAAVGAVDLTVDEEQGEVLAVHQQPSPLPLF
ncbi:hypothetical protein ACFQ7N_10710 [Streptomyces niveus]|uniref:hypothetical protein n=1 Tax=Streptomyces niveus TaxID=193462 RepID=UPI00368A6789